MNLTKEFIPEGPQDLKHPQGRSVSGIQYFFLFSLFFIICLFFVSLPYRTLNIDEAILGEHAYWLAKIGKVKANMYAGTGVGWEKELLVYHKLFIWAGAGIISFFGLSLTLLRSFSLIFAIGLCILLYYYCKNYSSFSKERVVNVYMFSLLLILLNAHFFAFSFIYRPEIMLAFLGFGSFYALSAYLQKEKSRYIILAAILAGIATITHLNGLIYIGAGAILLFINKKYKPAFLFGTVAAMVSALYVANMVMDPGSWERFLWQFKGDPAIEKEDLSLTDRFIRFFHEHKRYFHSYVEGSVSVLFLLCVIFKGKYLWREHRNLLLYPLICAFLLACISQGLTSKYPLLFLPQAFLIIAFAFYHFFSTTFAKEKLIIAGTLLFIYAGIQIHHNRKIIDSSGMSTESRNALIGSHIPKGSHVYSNVSFFFNEVENFTISSLIAYDLLVFRYYKLNWTKEDLFQHIHSLGCHYIAFDLLKKDSTVEELFSQSDFEVGKNHFGYKVVRSRNDFVIMKRL